MINPSDSQLSKLLADFVAYAATLQGDEKGEAQVFCDRLFRAFGHDGYKEAGATLEERVARPGKAKGFADLVWPNRLLIEMKKRGTALEGVYQQALDYWIHLAPNRPRYVMLCNFDEFWIYDFDLQVDEPVDIVKVADLNARANALAFLLPTPKTPLFKNNRVDVTREAARRVTRVWESLTRNAGIAREDAQRFVLACVVAMFSEDAELLPRGFFSRLLADAANTTDADERYDLFAGLFRQMNSPTPAAGGRFAPVAYFNGGLFSELKVPAQIKLGDASLLEQAAQENWSKVQPAIFGTLFQDFIENSQRHALGAHFTSELDVHKIVNPTIVRPWRERIEAVENWESGRALHAQLTVFRVLDPACGGGNFLYVAYRELKRLELLLLERLHELNPDATLDYLQCAPSVSTRQFHGIDTNALSVELARVTLMIAKEITVSEMRAAAANGRSPLPPDWDAALPLDNLDEQIVVGDSLFCAWPDVDCIVGNPPFQSKNKMAREFGADYVARVRERYPDVPGRADFCVYWFRRAHDRLQPGQRAGLVGTNTIRQNFSREGGLDYIVANGGTITEAVSTQVWSGDAAVHVSLVNWIKGAAPGPHALSWQVGNRADSPFELRQLPFISSSLSESLDVASALKLRTNADSGACYQGQTHGHEGFLLTPDEARTLLTNSANADVVRPYLTYEELVKVHPLRPIRYVIDFGDRDQFAAAKYKKPFAQVKEQVLPTRTEAAQREIERNKTLEGTKARGNKHHANFFKTWWKLSYQRGEMMKELASVPRYIAGGQVMQRQIFEFISSEISPNARIIAFPMADDYSFGIIQSSLHWDWFRARCATLGTSYCYTSDSVFDSFGWPQNPTRAQALDVAASGRELRALRHRVMDENNWSLRELYRHAEAPGDNPLKSAQAKLDAATRAAYAMKPSDEALAFLLALNAQLAAREAANEPIAPPGLPAPWRDDAAFFSDDCMKAPL